MAVQLATCNIVIHMYENRKHKTYLLFCNLIATGILLGTDIALHALYVASAWKSITYYGASFYAMVVHTWYSQLYKSSSITDIGMIITSQLQVSTQHKIFLRKQYIWLPMATCSLYAHMAGRYFTAC